PDAPGAVKTRPKRACLTRGFGINPQYTSPRESSDGTRVPSCCDGMMGDGVWVDGDASLGLGQPRWSTRSIWRANEVAPVPAAIIAPCPARKRRRRPPFALN